MIRFFDIIFSLAGLVILSPFLLIIVVWIKLDSSGPVFYKQVRVGKNGKDFILFKFRTMRLESDKGSLITIGSRDPRITTSGYYLRKFKIDELPQLINVLCGEMSLVGPRPEVRKYVDLYTEEQIQILSVTPGITDYASIKFRNENDLLSRNENPEHYYVNVLMPEKIRISLPYVMERKVAEYFRILFLTVICVFSKN